MALIQCKECGQTGMAIAIPLAHFQVTPQSGQKKPVRKLLCFADHRQRAAAFPDGKKNPMLN
jgi:hypothetical protein